MPKISTSPVDPVQRIPEQNVDAEFLVQRGLMRYERFTLDRVEWMKRRTEFYLGWDDYLAPGRKGLWDGASNLHLPLTEIQATVMHALIMQATVFNYPWFYVDPQEEVDTFRIRKAERFMKYILERYANNYKGIYNAVDDWSWDLVTDGMAIFSRNWQTKQRRFLDVVENDAFKRQRLDLQKMLEDTDEAQFDLLAKQLIKTPYEEKAIIRTIFDGPVVVAEDPTFILFKGLVVDSTDLDQHQTVIKVCYFTESELISFAQSQYMDEDAVAKVIAGPGDRYGRSVRGYERIRLAQDIETGINTRNHDEEQEKHFEVLCVTDTTHLKPGLAGMMPDRIQYFIHSRSLQLLRWTYLDRISTNGKINMHMAHLFRRPRRSTGRGMVMTFSALNEVQDILVNQAIDAGMLANNPMFAYKGNSSFDPEEVRVEPGIGIKADDPNSDIRFFTWNVNPNWSVPIQATISGMASQLTAIGPQSSGQVGQNVGPLRSTSGVQALGQMGAVQQQVIINRAKGCMSELFEGLYSDCQNRMQEKIKITITGQEGIPVYDDDGNLVQEEISKEDLRMRLHFGLYANAGNMSQASRIQNAAAIMQMSLTPVAIQTGAVSADNVRELLVNMHEAYGTIRIDRFVSKVGQVNPLSLKYEMLMIMQGEMPPIVLNDPEHQDKIDFMNNILTSDEAKNEVQYGKVAANAMDLLKAAIKKHTVFLQTAQKPSNIPNPLGNNQSPTPGGNTQVGDQMNVHMNEGDQNQITNMQQPANGQTQMGPSGGQGGMNG